MQIMRNLALAIGVAAAAAHAQTTNSFSTKSLALNDCIQLALQHNFDVRIERVNPEIARYNVSLAYAGYDPGLDFRATHSYNSSLGTLINGTLSIPASATKSDSFNVGIGGAAPIDSGLTYSLNASVSQTVGDRFNPISTVVTNGGVVTTNTSFLAAPFQNANGSVSISLTQPLLKNLWIDNIRYNIQISKSQLRGTEWGLRGRIIDIITQVETAYYNLIAARENVKVQEKALQLAEQLLAENKKKVEVGALAQLDEKQAESQVASSRADLLTAQNTLGTRQRVLKNLLSDDYSEWSNVLIDPAEPLTAVPQMLNLQASWQNGLTMRPDLEQARLNADQLGITLKFQRNQLFPQLDLTGTFGRNGNSGVYSEVFGQIRDAEGPFYSVGAEFRIPLGNQAARNNYKITKAQRAQALLRLKQLEQTIMVGIEDAVGTAIGNYERVKATREASSYADEALKAEQKKLENGKSTNFEVLQLQKNLTAARSAEIQALADYNNALAALAASEGTTLQRLNLSLEVK